MVKVEFRTVGAGENACDGVGVSEDSFKSDVTVLESSR